MLTKDRFSFLTLQGLSFPVYKMGMAVQRRSRHGRSTPKEARSYPHRVVRSLDSADWDGEERTPGPWRLLFPQNLTPWHFQSGTKSPNLPAGSTRFPAQWRLHTASLSSQITGSLFAFGVWVCVFLSLSLFKARDIYFQSGHQDFHFVDGLEGFWGSGGGRGENGGDWKRRVKAGGS